MPVREVAGPPGSGITPGVLYQCLLWAARLEDISVPQAVPASRQNMICIGLHGVVGGCVWHEVTGVQRSGNGCRMTCAGSGWWLIGLGCVLGLELGMHGTLARMQQ